MSLGLEKFNNFLGILFSLRLISKIYISEKESKSEFFGIYWLMSLLEYSFNPLC